MSALANTAYRRWCARRVHDALADLEARRGREHLITIGFTVKAITDVANGLSTGAALSGLDHLRQRHIVVEVDTAAALWALHPECGDRAAA